MATDRIEMADQKGISRHWVWKVRPVAFSQGSRFLDNLLDSFAIEFHPADTRGVTWHSLELIVPGL